MNLLIYSFVCYEIEVILYRAIFVLFFRQSEFLDCLSYFVCFILLYFILLYFVVNIKVKMSWPCQEHSTLLHFWRIHTCILICIAIYTAINFMWYSDVSTVKTLYWWILPYFGHPWLPLDQSLWWPRTPPIREPGLFLGGILCHRKKWFYIRNCCKLWINSTLKWLKFKSHLILKLIVSVHGLISWFMRTSYTRHNMILNITTQCN